MSPSVSVFLSSLCPGGTDIVSCFMGQNPTVPVYRGEIQTRNLGIAVEAWSPDGILLLFSLHSFKTLSSNLQNIDNRVKGSCRGCEEVASLNPRRDWKKKLLRKIYHKPVYKLLRCPLSKLPICFWSCCLANRTRLEFYSIAPVCRCTCMHWHEFEASNCWKIKRVISVFSQGKYRKQLQGNTFLP